MADELDYKIIERQLAILMTNSVAFASKLYDMFVSSTPMDIEFNVWTAVDEFETITVPNRAKGNIPASYGKGAPEGQVEASYGSIYLDQEDGSVYIKATLEGSEGWLKIITDIDLNNHNRSTAAHDGTLAKIDGAYANGIPSTFIVADAIEGVEHESEELNDEYYAVNKGSLFKLLGGLENLRTEDKTDVVSAINEVSEASNFDACCAISGSKNVFSNNAAFMSIFKDENDDYSLKLSAPFVVTSPSGKKYTFKKDIVKKLADAGVQDGKICSIYLSIEKSIGSDEIVGRIEIKNNGLFYRQARRPYILSEKDGWLDTSSAPYRFVIIEKNEYNKLVEVEKDYVYLGELEQDMGDD